MSDDILTRVVINRLLARGRKLLHALSRKPAIRRIAAQSGYTNAEHQLGWETWLYLMGYGLPPAAPTAPRPEYDAAVATLDQWDGPNFERSRAALERLHPEQASYIFNNLNAGSDAESVAAVNTYVNRVAALREGTDPSRKATRDADKAAVATLAARNIFNPEVETYLRGLIATAAAGEANLPPAPPPEEDDPEFQAKALEFKKWLEDWRRTLRSAVTRRDYQIQLGLVSRRSVQADDDVADDEDVADEDE